MPNYPMGEPERVKSWSVPLWALWLSGSLLVLLIALYFLWPVT